MKIGDICFHRGVGAQVEIIGEFSTHFQVRHGKQVFSASKVAGVDLMPPVEHPENVDLIEEESQKKTININQMTADAIAKSLSGVGNLAAKQILDRKPEGGYLGIENLQKINADLKVNWEAITPHLTF